jgi:hypothetical protein
MRCRGGFVPYHTSVSVSRRHFQILPELLVRDQTLRGGRHSFLGNRLLPVIRSNPELSCAGLEHVNKYAVNMKGRKSLVAAPFADEFYLQQQRPKPHNN